MTVDRLPEEVISALAAKFRSEHEVWGGFTVSVGPLRAAWTALIPECVAPVQVRLSGFSGSPFILGTDGSVNDELATWAAVTGDGRAHVGWFTGSDCSSNRAEMWAVAGGLRCYPDGAQVQVRLDNDTAIEALRYINGTGEIVQAHPRTGRPMAWCGDAQAAQEMAEHMARLHVSVVYIGDPEGDTNPKRCPADPPMRAAHRLAWCTQRCLLYGFDPYDEQVAAWLGEFASGTARASHTLRGQFDRWLGTRAPIR